MNNLFKAMAYQQLRFHVLMLGLLLAAVVVQRTLSVEIVVPGIGFYAWVCLLLFAIKPYSSKNWTWIRTLPISRLSVLGFVLAESFIVIPLCLLCASFTYFLAYPADLDQLELSSTVPWLMQNVLGVSGLNWYYFILGVIALSPSFFVIFQPMNAKTSGQNPSAKTISKWVAILFGIALAFYFAPVLTAAVCGSIFLGFLGNYALRLIFPRRGFQKWAKGYGVLVGLSVIAIVASQVELSAEREARPALRMKYYGFLAPRIDRSALLTLLANPDLADESRIEIAEFEKSRTPSNKAVSTEELREWSAKSPSNRVFFQGLTLFQGEIWTPQALIQLEDELKRRCRDGLQRSKWAAIWRCELDANVLNQPDQPLRLQLIVREDPELLDLLTPEHPLISSMLIQASLLSSADESWKPKMEALVTAKVPVVSDQAQMWVDRLTLNPKGKWDCSSRRREKDVVCTEVDTISSVGVKIESSVANDPGGSISVKFVRNDF